MESIGNRNVYESKRDVEIRGTDYGYASKRNFSMEEINELLKKLFGEEEMQKIKITSLDEENGLVRVNYKYNGIDSEIKLNDFEFYDPVNDEREEYGENSKNCNNEIKYLQFMANKYGKDYLEDYQSLFAVSADKVAKKEVENKRSQGLSGFDLIKIYIKYIQQINAIYLAMMKKVKAGIKLEWEPKPLNEVEQIKAYCENQLTEFNTANPEEQMQYTLAKKPKKAEKEQQTVKEEYSGTQNSETKEQRPDEQAEAKEQEPEKQEEAVEQKPEKQEEVVEQKPEKHEPEKDDNLINKKEVEKKNKENLQGPSM